MNKIYFFDIDGTICSRTNGEYEKAVPWPRRIGMVNRLFDKGHTIIYWTGRGNKTGVDWRDLTERQLKDWGAKYHQLILKKPYYDYFIDDQSINAFPFFHEDTFLYETHLNPEKHPFVNEFGKLVTNADVYGPGGIINYM